jgi:hypothetical protein
MTAPRLYRDPLAIFLAVVIGILIGCLWERMRSPSFDEAVVRLREGDLERTERKGLQRLVMDAPLPPSRDRDLAGAMAALCLDDADRFRAFAGRLGEGEPPIGQADIGLLPAAALGEPCLERLLAGWLDESRGRQAEAKAAYAQAVTSAERWRLPLAGALARKGLERLR